MVVPFAACSAAAQATTGPIVSLLPLYFLLQDWKIETNGLVCSLASPLHGAMFKKMGTVLYVSNW